MLSLLSSLSSLSSSRSSSYAQSPKLPKLPKQFCQDPSFPPLALAVVTLRASARLLSFPRLYSILNLYCPNSSNYLTCLLLSAFIVVKLTRFLQLVYIVSSKQLSAYCLYCSKALTTASNSLLYMLQFYSTKDIFLKKQATRCYFPSFSQYKHAPTARSNTSILILAGLFALKLYNTSGFIYTSFSLLNTVSYSFPYWNSLSFFIASVNRSAFFEYSLINR